MIEILYTTEQAAELLDVPAEAIANWKARHRIAPASVIKGRGRGGTVPLYRLEELQPLVDSYRIRVATRRRDGKIPGLLG